MEIWLTPGNADYWGNMLALEVLEKPMKALKSLSVVTVGDGKGGKEAVFFGSTGHRVLATDVSTVVLEEAKKRELIEECAKADAEALPFDDESYDIVATKETLHHLPRPYLAIYEMLRVARKGVIIIEPHYRHPSLDQMSLATCIRHVIRRIIKGRRVGQPHKVPPASYEVSGNFKFQFNPYELTQLARAAGLPAIAYGYAHHFFQKGCDSIKGNELERLNAVKRQEFAIQDAKEGLQARPFLVAVLWKEKMPDDFAAALREQRFQLYELINPRMTASHGH